MTDRREGDDEDDRVEVQQSVDLPVEAAYELVTGAEGLACWMGTGAPDRLDEDTSFELDDGTSGEVRLVEPGERLRLTWHPDGWDEPSTLEVRVVEAPAGTTAIEMHHGDLPDASTRDAMRAWWTRALRALIERADASDASGSSSA